jgi:EpsI family protein
VQPQKHLDAFPAQLGVWKMQEDQQLSPSLLDVLRADSYVSRWYQEPSGDQVELFIAYYRNQSAGETMHSPQNCLPGSGWQPVMKDRIVADLGSGRLAKVNRYVVEKDGRQALVLYWYQAHGRIIADEYLSKLYLVWDAIHLHRHDGAIVRFSVMLPPDANTGRETQSALKFARAVSQNLADFVPN